MAEKKDTHLDKSKISKEKRGDIRHGIPRSVEFFVRGKPFIGKIVNQSRNGLFIQVRGSFKIGEDLFLIDSSTFATVKKRKAKIARVTDEGIGVTFERPGYF